MTLARRRLIGLGAPTFGLGLAATAVGAYLPLLAHQRGASNAMIGLLLAAQGIALALLSVVVGRMSDSIGSRSDYLLVGCAAGAMALTLAALAGVLWLMVAGALLFYISYVVACEPYRALILDAAPADRISSAQAAQAVWRTSGSAVALVLGGALAAISVDAPLLCAAACLLVAGVAGRLTLPLKAPEAHHRRSSIWHTLTANASLRRSVFIAALAELAQAVVRAFGLLYATQELHISAGAASFMFAGAVAVNVIAAVAGGAAANRIGPRPVALTGSVLLAAGLAAVAAGARGTVTLAIAAVAASVGGGVLSALTYVLGAREIPASLRGGLTGATSAARGIGMTLGPLLGGVAVTAGGHAAAFWVATTAAVMMLGALLRSRPQTPGRATKTTHNNPGNAYPHPPIDDRTTHERTDPCRTTSRFRTSPAGT